MSSSNKWEVYSRLSDSELEYSLQRINEERKRSIEGMVAARILDRAYDRTLGRLFYDPREDVDDWTDTAVEAEQHYDVALEQAEEDFRDVNSENYERKFEEIQEDAIEWIEDIAFDGTGLRGIAKYN